MGNNGRTQLSHLYLVTEAPTADATVTRMKALIASYWLGKPFRTGLLLSVILAEHLSEKLYGSLQSTRQVLVLHVTTRLEMLGDGFP